MRGTETAAQVVVLVQGAAQAVRLLSVALDDDGFLVESVETGADLHRRLRTGQPADLIILTLALPDMDGLALLADVSHRYDVPVVVCSETQERRNTLLAFRLGADEVIAGPFDADELTARVHAVLRRAAKGAARQPSGHVAPARARAVPGSRAGKSAGITLDHIRRTAHNGTLTVALTATEYRLLRELLTHRDSVLTRQFLAARVWGSESAGVGRTIDVHIRRVRAKLARLGARAPMVLTVRGTGYRLVDAGGHGQAIPTGAASATTDHVYDAPVTGALSCAGTLLTA
jgi:DNA-binding response OmpR family regulator